MNFGFDGGAEFQQMSTRSEARRLNWSDISEFVRAQILVLGIGVIGGGLLGLWYTMVATPRYMATAEILINPRPIAPMRAPLVDSILSLDVPYIDTQIAVMRSGNLTNKILTDLALWSDPEFADPKLLTAKLNKKQMATIRARIAENFQKRLVVRRKGQSYVIEVSFSSSSPEKAAKITNAVTRGYMSDQIESRTRSLGRGNEWYDHRIERIRLKMNEATFALRRFKARADYRITNAAPVAGGEAPPTLDELEAMAKTYRNLYENYLRAQTDLMQQQSFPIANARIISPALVPMDSSLRTRWVILLAAIAGGMLGLGIALLRHRPSSAPGLG